MNSKKNIFTAIKKTFLIKKYFNYFILFSMFFLALLIIIPVLTTPGNSLAFQLSIFTFWNYVLIVVLSLLMGIMIPMQLYSNHLKKSLKNIKGGIIGGLSAFIAGIFGTAACSSCIAVFFGFLGIGGVLFLARYQWYIVGGSAILILISIYLLAKKINNDCEVCK